MRSHKLDSKKKLITCSIPQTHWIGGRPQAEFQSHRDMINAFTRLIQEQGL